LPRHGAAVMKLMEIEAEFEDQRKGSDANYSLVQHIDVMIALVSESRSLRAAQT
jgi:hypothetical protein